MVLWLVERGADVNYPQSRPILAIAALGGDIEILRLLLAHGAQVNRLNDQCESAYDLAKSSGLAQTARWLVEHGADDQAGERCLERKRIADGELAVRRGVSQLRLTDY